MKRILTILAAVFLAANMDAQTSTKMDWFQSVPVKKWEFDLYNYGLTGGQETVYLFTWFALRYNFENHPVDIGGEISIGAQPPSVYDYDDPELGKGYAYTRGYTMFSAVTHYNIRRGRNVSFYIGMGSGAGCGMRYVLEKRYFDSDGELIQEWDSERYFVAALTPRIGIEFFRHFRLGFNVRIPTDGEITSGISMSFLILGGGKKR